MSLVVWLLACILFHDQYFFFYSKKGNKWLSKAATFFLFKRENLFKPNFELSLSIFYFAIFFVRFEHKRPPSMNHVSFPM